MQLSEMFYERIVCAFSFVDKFLNVFSRSVVSQDGADNDGDVEAEFFQSDESFDLYIVVHVRICHFKVCALFVPNISYSRVRDGQLRKIVIFEKSLIFYSFYCVMRRACDLQSYGIL